MLTHTRPGPPPGAGVAAPVAVVTGAAAGEVLTEDFGLKKSLSVDFRGDAEGLAAAGLAAALVICFFRVRFASGETAGLADVVAAASACFFRARFGLGDAAGDSAVEGDAACSAGEAAGSAFLCVRCFFGEGDSAGDPAGAGD